MHSSLQIILASFSGILGSIIGIIISGSASEELQANKKTLAYIENIILLALCALFFFNILDTIYGGIISMFAAILIFGPERKVIVEKIVLYIPLLFSFIYLFFAKITIPQSFELGIALFGLFFIVHTGRFLAERQKQVKKGIWKKKIWKLCMYENIVSLLAPLLAITIIIIL